MEKRTAPHIAEDRGTVALYHSIKNDYSPAKSTQIDKVKQFQQRRGLKLKRGLKIILISKNLNLEEIAKITMFPFNAEPSLDFVKYLNESRDQLILATPCAIRDLMHRDQSEAAQT